MFLGASNSFSKLNIPGRRNMLSYCYVTLKCLELLGCREFITCVHTLKGHEKLVRADSI
jgi:hypothetical protein